MAFVSSMAHADPSYWLFGDKCSSDDALPTHDVDKPPLHHAYTPHPTPQLPHPPQADRSCSPDSDSDRYVEYSASKRRTRGTRRIVTHIAVVSALLMVAYSTLNSLTNIAAVSQSKVGGAPELGSLFGQRGSRNLLVVPYCALANRLTIMIESLSISAESGRTSILNW